MSECRYCYCESGRVIRVCHSCHNVKGLLDALAGLASSKMGRQLLRDTISSINLDQDE